MIRYIPAPAAQQMSDKLWDLTRPPQVQAQPDQTQFMFGWITATDGSRWLEVDTEFTIPVHVEAVLDSIADILQPYIDSGHLPSDTNTVLEAFVESRRGQLLVVYDAFPAFFKAASKTLAEMQSLGLIAPADP